MHECPECGSACDCDGEDHEQPAPNDCSHDCEANYDFSDDEAQYNYED